MSVQVLVAAMNQTDHSLLDKMNIRTDVIVGNQCDFDSVERFTYYDHSAVYLNFKERGVGLNRNNALMRASGDFCLFADDDMVYENGYEETVEKAFAKHPDADVLIFNIVGRDKGRDRIVKDGRVNRLNYLRYGTARIAVRLSSIRNNAIYFNQCFGGGTEHCHGEDNLFLTACLDHKMKIYAVPDFIATLTEERESTWNVGYDSRYLKDQGALYRAISKRWWKLLCFQDAVRRKKDYGMSGIKAFRLMTKQEN